MIRPAPARARRAKTLVRQESDFTAEGAPAPGAVPPSVPAAPPAKAMKPLARTGVRKGPPQGRYG